MSMTTTEAAKAIRGALKAELGCGPRDVSVRCDQYSMGSTIHVVVKRAGVKLADVERIAKIGERIYRDDSGEILGGGNRFIEVRYCSSVLDPMQDLYASKLERSDVVQVDGWECFRMPNGSWMLHFDGDSAHCYTTAGAARHLALEILAGRFVVPALADDCESDAAPENDTMNAQEAFVAWLEAM